MSQSTTTSLQGPFGEAQIGSLTEQIDDDDLLLYVDGDVDQKKMQIIEGDTALEARARRLGHAQNRLQEKLRGHDCPSTTELGEYHLGLMESMDHVRIQEHIRQCGNCLEQLNSLAEFMLQAQPVIQHDNRMREPRRLFLYPRVPPVTGSTLAMASGFRNRSTSGQLTQINDSHYMYHFSYEDEQGETYSGDISLQIQKTKDSPRQLHNRSNVSSQHQTQGLHKSLTGLITGNLNTLFDLVELVDNKTTTPIAQAEVNKFGGFILPQIQEGAYELHLKSETQCVCLRELHV
ncbi:MAG: hypothetical protein AAF639_08890 [Chloroflexota bacterium]